MRALLFALIVSCFAGCGDGRTLVVVKLTGPRDGIATLGAVAVLGAQSAEPQLFTPDVSDFGLALPAGSSGPLEVDVVGLDAANCLVASGSATATVNDQSEIDLVIELIAVPRKC